jgi:hypothetical protein
MFKSTALALSLGLAMIVSATAATARPHNPPGPAGGPGTDWRNPPGPVGGPGASRYRYGNPPGPVGGPGAGPRWRGHYYAYPPYGYGSYGPAPYRYAHGPRGLYWHPRGYWCRFDRDDNPPGPRGGPGTNWENPPGPRGGPGASPNSRYRRC